MLPAQPNQSLIDGLACLQAIAGADEPVRGRELARTLGLEPTRSNRLLRTLAHLGLAEQDENRRYRPGPGIHVLAAQALYGSGLLARAAPHLEALRDTGLVVAMGVLWRDQVTYLYHASPETPPAEAIGRVGLFPAERSGLGLAILAGRTFRELHRIYTTRRQRRRIDEAVRATRQHGYAIATHEDGQQTIGVALDNAQSAAIGLAGRIAPKQIEPIARRLQQARNDILHSTTPETMP